MGKRRYNGRLFTREQVYICGDYMEANIYPVFQRPGIRRSKAKASSEVQKKLNEKNSIQKASRIAHANFTEQDLALHLSYAREPESIEDAKRLLNNFLKRLSRAYAKAGLELKYMKRTEKGKKAGRIHHHLYITGGLDRDYIEKLWSKGRCNSRRLQFGEDGIMGLTAYIAGAGKNRDTYCRWTCSRNCIRPEPEEHDGRLSNAEADEIGMMAADGMAFDVLEQLYPEWECILCEGSKNEFNKSWYTHAIFRRRPETKIRT
ncbi:MAG: hypothetical protein IKK78_00050 [Oscillospiraceae bacterium]|nr:hypothetical protein [Oscillospiraceae bacterium]